MKTLFSAFFLLLYCALQSQYIMNLEASQNNTNRIKVYMKVYLPSSSENLSYTTDINQNIITINACYYMIGTGEVTYYEKDFYIDVPQGNYTLKANLYISWNETTCDYHSLEDTATLTFTTPIEGTVSLNTTELQSQSEKPKVFPNPAKDVLNIKTTSTIDKITIFDTAGKLVFTVQKPGDKIDVAKLTNGVYFFEIMSNKKKWREKIIIKK